MYACVSLCCVLVCIQHCEHYFINRIVAQIHLFLTDVYPDKETEICVFVLNIRVALTLPISGGGSCYGHLQEQFPVDHVPKKPVKAG